MSKLIKILLVLVLPPLVSFILLCAAQGSFTKTLRTDLYQAFKTEEGITKDSFSNITAKAFCSEEEGRAAAPEFCRDIKLISYAKIAAVIVIAAAIIYILWVNMLGKKARNRREILLDYFKKALFITSLVTVILLLINIAVLLAALFFAEVALLGSYHPTVLLILAFAGVVGVYVVIKAVWYALQKPEQYITARILTQEDQPEVWAFVTEVARKMKARTPDNIIAGIEPTFYATEVDNIVLDSKLTGETLYLSIPLSRILTKDELRSILGHELAHFAGSDVKYTTEFYPIYSGAFNAVAMFYEQAGGNLFMMLGLLPARTIFSFFLDVFSQAEREISRARELNADKESARKASTPKDSATALIKIHAYAPVFEEVYQKMAKAIQEGKSEENVGRVYETYAKNLSLEKATENLELKGLAHPTDSHPTLAERLDNLKIPVDEVLQKGLNIVIEDPAVNIIRGHELIENELTSSMNSSYLEQLKAFEAAQKK